jgi:GNAT superfamily N-acetyltransferase
MIFREITIDDIPDLFRIRTATWDSESPAEEMATLGITPQAVERMLINGSHQGWICEKDAMPVGFAMGNRENGEMWVIAVLKEYEARGIGKRLLGLVEDWLWSQGWDESWLTTYQDEAIRAVGFYRSLGWTDWKIDERQNRYMRKSRPVKVTQLS